MRKHIVAGNWKMNKSLEEGKQLASEVVNMVEDEVLDGTKVVIIPPFIHLSQISKIVEGSSKVSLGAQNCNENESGAYTGEVSVSMLLSVGVEYVLVGHSERREYYNESDELLAKKADAVLAGGLTPIFCCGEPLEIRQAETHENYVRNQLTQSLFHLGESDFRKLVIAYEPIWAIGTGMTASTGQAQDMHACIRQHLASKYGDEAADECTIQYGGSCKPSNAREIFAGADVDGGLIGGAALQSRDFTDIAKSF
jgi:triosephosphate isomerase